MAARSAVLWVLRRSAKIDPRSTPSAAQPITSVIRPAPMIAKLPRSSTQKRFSWFRIMLSLEPAERNRRRSHDGRWRRRYEWQRKQEHAGGVVADAHHEHVRVGGRCCCGDADIARSDQRIGADVGTDVAGGEAGAFGRT